MTFLYVKFDKVLPVEARPKNASKNEFECHPMADRGTYGAAYWHANWYKCTSSVHQMLKKILWRHNRWVLVWDYFEPNLHIVVIRTDRRILNSGLNQALPVRNFTIRNWKPIFLPNDNKVEEILRLYSDESHLNSQRVKRFMADVQTTIFTN